MRAEGIMKRIIIFIFSVVISIGVLPGQGRVQPGA
jgi:hypothetical protein